MSTIATPDVVNDGEVERDTDLDVAVPSPSDAPQTLYTRVKLAFAPFLPIDEGKTDKPAPQQSPKAFTNLGSTMFGAPTDIDDRLNILQGAIKLMSTLGPKSKVTKTLSATAVALLHNDKRRALPADLVVPATQTSVPHSFIRRVGTPLAFTPLPDPETVFRTLLQESSAVDHPNEISGLAPVLATVISLSLLRINGKKPDHNQTSPYLDLSPLYGVNDAEMDMVREKDGRGMLSPDCFYEDRIMLLPPAVSAFLILWNRNHNFIARHLMLNNEGKKWVDPFEYPFSPDGILTARLQTQDDEIFTTARLINCVQFKNVVAEDFLKLLMGLSSVEDSPNLDILMDNKQSEKGKGHISSMEFGLLHNWTSMMAAEDVKTIEATVEAEFSMSLDQLSTDDVQSMLNSTQNQGKLRRRQRDGAGLQRGVDGRFRDDDLARVLQDETEYCAGGPGARRISSCFYASEKLVIERARQWEVCSFNDFRKFLGLKALKNFNEWNPDPDVARAAEELYRNIDNLELYPGLQAEQAMPGSGLGLGYTMTYGLLVDIVTMIRSDDRFTTEFTPGKLTQWGYNDCTFPLKNGASGCWLPKLLQRNLPRNYPSDNIYSLFPLICPTKTRSVLQSRSNSRDQYDLERPKVRKINILESKKAISHVFNKPSVYHTVYGKDLETLTDGYGYFLGFDNEMLHDQDLMMTLFALIPDKGTLSRYATYFGKTAAALIRDKSTPNNGHRSIDIIRDVINVTCTRWVCETLCAIPLPADQEIKRHEEFAALYAFVFRNIDPESGWEVRTSALNAARELAGEIERRLPIPSDSIAPAWTESFKSSVMDLYAFFARIREEMGPGKRLSENVTGAFLDRIVKSNRNFRLGELTKHGHLRNIVNISKDDFDILKREEALEKRRVVGNVLGLAVVTAINYAQACAQAVDFYLDDAYKKEREEIVRLSTLSAREARSQDANRKIMGYVREAQRIGQPLGLWRDVAENDSIPRGDGLPDMEVKKGDRVFADFNRAHMNAVDFPNPHQIDPDRKTPSIQGMGLHKCPGIGFVDETMPELFKAIFRLKNLRRNTGKAGRLERFACHPAPSQSDPKVYLDPTGGISHVPPSLSLLYDDDGSTEGSPSKPRRRKWEILVGKKTEILRRIADRAMSTVVVSLLFFIFLYMFLSMASRVRVPRRRPPPTVADVKTESIDCSMPTTVFQPYDIHTILPGPDGHPLPLEYTLDYHKAHMLSVVDIDARDMQMAIYVDDELRGLTRDFELNKAVDCGEDVRTCLSDGWSAGLVIVRPGNHTVRIEWVGKDYIPDTHDIDWGTERRRRLSWQREYCA